MPTLQELRKQERLSQTELGELLGVSQRNVANYERKICRVPPEIASKIKDVFNLTTDEMWNALYKDSA